MSTRFAPSPCPSSTLEPTTSPTGQRRHRRFPTAQVHHRGGAHLGEFLGPNVSKSNPRATLSLSNPVPHPSRRRPLSPRAMGTPPLFLQVGCQPRPSQPMCWAGLEARRALTQSEQCTFSFSRDLIQIKSNLIQTLLNLVAIQMNLDFDQINPVN
jgi:hypothetical protein